MATDYRDDVLTAASELFRHWPSVDRRGALMDNLGAALRVAKVRHPLYDQDAIIRASQAAQDAIGASLARSFPASTTGDENPLQARIFAQAAEGYARAWIETNAPGPATYTELVAALVAARNALASFRDERDTRWTREDDAALGTVQIALNRTRMSDDDLPRP